MLPIREEVEACEEVEPLVLPEPPNEVIVGFLGGKDIEMLVTSKEEYEKYLLSLG
jgi:hypothetical protein